MASQAAPLLGPVEREPGWHHDRDAIRHSSPNAGRRALVRDRAHRKRVVVHDAIATAQEVDGGGASRGCRPRRVAQPAVQGLLPAIEAPEIVPVGAFEELLGTLGRDGQDEPRQRLAAALRSGA